MKDEVSVFNSLYALTTNTENDEDNSITLFGIKENLKDYSLIKLRSLVFVLLDSQVKSC